MDKDIEPRRQSLCWFCQRSVLTEDACCWALDFEPVNGWEAEKRPIKIGDGAVNDSYYVKRCPLFLADHMTDKELDQARKYLEYPDQLPEEGDVDIYMGYRVPKGERIAPEELKKLLTSSITEEKPRRRVDEKLEAFRAIKRIFGI